MTVFAVNGNKFTTTADIIDEIFLGVELISELVKIGDFELGAEFYRAFLRCQFAQ